MIYRWANGGAGRSVKEWLQWSRWAMTVAWIEVVAIKVKKNGQIQDIYCWLDLLMSICGLWRKERSDTWLRVSWLWWCHFLRWKDWNYSEYRKNHPDHLRFWVTGVDSNGPCNLLFTKVYSLIWQNLKLNSYKDWLVLLYFSSMFSVFEIM